MREVIQFIMNRVGNGGPPPPSLACGHPEQQRMQPAGSALSRRAFRSKVTQPGFGFGRGVQSALADPPAGSVGTLETSQYNSRTRHLFPPSRPIPSVELNRTSQWRSRLPANRFDVNCQFRRRSDFIDESRTESWYSLLQMQRAVACNLVADQARRRAGMPSSMDSRRKINSRLTLTYFQHVSSIRALPDL